MHGGGAEVLNNEDSDAEQRWSALLVEAGRLLDVQDTRAARATLEEAIAYVDQTWGIDDIRLIRPLRLMAESHWRQHDPLDPNNEREIECLQRALAIARMRLPPNHLEVARLAGEVGNGLVIAGRIDEGCELMLECLAIAHENASEDDFLRYLPGIGHARMAQSRPGEALPFFERAAIGYERRDPASVVHAIARYHFGNCLWQTGRPKEALDQFQRALSVLDAKRVHGSYARLMNEIMDTIERVSKEVQLGEKQFVGEPPSLGKKGE